MDSQSIMAANSRECESEADMVGLEIVSRACYNPSKAGKALFKYEEI